MICEEREKGKNFTFNGHYDTIRYMFKDRLLEMRIWDAESGIAAGVTILAIFGPLLFVEAVNIATGASRNDSQHIVSLMDNQMSQWGVYKPISFRLPAEIGGSAFGTWLTIRSHAKLTAETLAQRLRESQR